MIATIQHRHPASDKMVLQALVPFKVLYENAIFTQKSITDNVKTVDDESAVEQNTQYYQRKLNAERLKEIQKFIVDTILDEKDNLAVATLFPSSMILATQIEGLPDTKDSFEMDFGEAPVYIVDGQHRLMAMKMLYERMTQEDVIADEDVSYIRRYLEDYRFNTTILVNYDLWEQGQVFVNVNFKQKPVNKSLYYEVFGAEYSEDAKDWTRNRIYVAHKLTECLNNYNESPFNGKIKMLGTGKGYVSQAFFVEAILPQLRSQGAWGDEFYNLEKDVVEVLATELISYFEAIRKTFMPYWGEQLDGKISHLCKTTGIGAFMRLFPAIHQNVGRDALREMRETKEVSLMELYVNEVQDILAPLKPHSDYLFGNDSKFAKSGGKGLAASLYKDILAKLAAADALKRVSFLYTQQEIVEQVGKRRTASLGAMLAQIGIKDVGGDLEIFLNNNLPSELDALGMHVRVEDVFDVTYIRLEKTSSRDYVLSGRFNCEVSDYMDSDDASKFTMVFPAHFSLRYTEKDGVWVIAKDGSQVYVNTESFYR